MVTAAVTVQTLRPRTVGTSSWARSGTARTSPKARSDGGFKNHGERTRTMVELAKRLGYGARVGAHQANFGTPFENGIADLQAQLAEAKAAGNQAEVERLENELAQAIENAKPGKGPDDSWATADSMSTMTGWLISATSTLWMRSRSAPPARINPAR